MAALVADMVRSVRHLDENMLISIVLWLFAGLGLRRDRPDGRDRLASRLFTPRHTKVSDILSHLEFPVEPSHPTQGFVGIARGLRRPTYSGDQENGESNAYKTYCSFGAGAGHGWRGYGAVIR
ncbi:hypothetical protein RFM68_24190 [Mesorhizobium sp. MSK_1335]|uniref:Transposase n=1 Tax=Mesorhizobium montanum TaxID=3072323 RepID=A0ABU4ZUJ4_9HYPH|nr:hypothetical protein [Mesorhizobium sp. MSK_1335]MDX8527606.1 hypothetical protein [Mesorhizobium sp. MSK_1335]